MEFRGQQAVGKRGIAGIDRPTKDLQLNGRVAWLIAAVGLSVGTLSCGHQLRRVEAQNASAELVQNGGFEDGGSPAPRGWFRDTSQTQGKGSAEQDQRRFHAGRASLKLSPTSRNSNEHSLAVAQIIPGAPYRGKTLEISGYMVSSGGATAVLGVLSVVRGEPQHLVAATEAPGGADFVLHRESYSVPDDPTVQLVIACSVSGTSGSAWFDDVSLNLPGGRAASTPASPAVPEVKSGRAGDVLTASVEIDASRVIRTIPRTLFGMDMEWVWNAYTAWNEKEHRIHPELERLARDLGVSLIRYPGGYYADFYHWRNGVGPYAARPEMVHAPGSKDKSRANFGTDEALNFARGIGAELLIGVNAGSGTAQEAADWVRYLNGEKQRARFFEVGNELYIKDGSPISRASAIDAKTYASRFRQFAQAMRAADPRIQVLGIGGANYGKYSFVSDPAWDRTLLEQNGDLIDYLSVHDAYAPVNVSDRQDFATVYRAMFAAPTLIARNLETVSKEIDRYAGPRASKIGIAVTEWGPLFQLDPNGKYLTHNKTLGSALFVASVLKVFVESPRVQIAAAHALSDLNIMGWIGSRNDSFPPQADWAPTPRYYAFQIYTRHFGEQLVASHAQGPAFDSEAAGLVEAVKGVPYLDIVSSLSGDGRRLFVIGINKHFDDPIEASIKLTGFGAAAEATAWTLNGSGIDANTGTAPLRLPGTTPPRQAGYGLDARIDKGGPGEVALNSAKVEGIGEVFRYRFPAHSVTSLELTRR
jgi:alpha-L-arabinofuranosidase